MKKQTALVGLGQTSRWPGTAKVETRQACTPQIPNRKGLVVKPDHFVTIFTCNLVLEF